jgi:SAM-dependent methyltransferase
MNEFERPQAAGSVDSVDEMIEPAVPERLRWLAGLVGARPGERIVDLGSGTGSALHAITEGIELELLGFDSSPSVLRTAARMLDARPHRRYLLAQADLNDPIPLASASTDRALCHNVLECLSSPDALVTDVHRVLRPGGRFVLSHSDFDTLVFASEDLDLTRRLVRSYCDKQQDWMEAVDGTIGRRLVDIVRSSPLRVDDVQARVNLSLRFQPGELGFAYAHNLTSTLRTNGPVAPAELDGWLAGLSRLDARGAFVFSINDYAVVATRP